jgi:hypothetical protein
VLQRGELGAAFDSRLAAAPNVRDPGNDVPRSYGATGIPETYFISARGEVVDHVIGVVSARDLSDGIAAARSGQLLGVRSGGARRPSR